MSTGLSIRLVCLALVTIIAHQGVTAQSNRDDLLDRKFQAAAQHYESGRYAEAAAKLEDLLHDAPDSFEVHELLGLVYSAQSQDAKANPHLQTAVRLQPNSVPARTNLGVNLLRLGKAELSAAEFKKAAELDPRNYDANHNLGEIYVRSGKIIDAIPFLERAQQINPSSYDNSYDLSLAYIVTGRLADGRTLIQQLLNRKNTAELHNLLGQLEEKDGNFVVAVNEYETAAHIDPSESNLFDWGSELLLHRTLDPAIEVFRQAAARYPDSTRLAIAFGIALYSRGNYDEAVASLLKAADLSPADPRCYFFLSKAYDSSPNQANEVIQRFRRFSERAPANALAQYYYALSLWKGKRMQDPDLDLPKIESLLKRSLTLDPKLADAHLQLGNLYSDQKKYSESIPEYLQVIQLTPDVADGHYRLGQAYVHVGEKTRAQEQLQLYQRLRAEHLVEIDKQRADIRQFIYSERDNSSTKP